MSKEVLVIGKESAGKSQLIASLSGESVYASNFRESTVACEAFRVRDYLLIDTPGIQRLADTVDKRAAMDRLKASEAILVVAPATTHLEEDLRDLLPLVEGRQVAVVVTFIDRMDEAGRNSLKAFGNEIGLPFVFLDARKLSGRDQDACHTMLGRPVSYVATVKLPLIREFGVPRRKEQPKRVTVVTPEQVDYFREVVAKILGAASPKQSDAAPEPVLAEQAFPIPTDSEKRIAQSVLKGLCEGICVVLASLIA